jgi:hypothetical protein
MTLKCSICGKLIKSQMGFLGHSKKHKKREINKNKKLILETKNDTCDS